LAPVEQVVVNTTTIRSRPGGLSTIGMKVIHAQNRDRLLTVQEDLYIYARVVFLNFVNTVTDMLIVTTKLTEL